MMFFFGWQVKRRVLELGFYAGSRQQVRPGKRCGRAGRGWHRRVLESPIMSCQRSTGTWLVTSIDALSKRSSTISSRSRACSAVRVSGPQSSRMSSLIRLRLLSSFPILPVATRQGESTKEAWNTLVEDGEILPACLLAESAGEPTFADATRSCDDESPLAGSSRRRRA